MKRLVIALCATMLPAFAGGCATGYGYGDVGPYAYNGYYDDYYGPIYDGYWGNDGFFYYRGGAGERRFRRGDGAHFHRDGPPPGGGFHNFGGTFNRGPGMHTPHFGGGFHGGGHGGGGHGGHH